VADGGTFDPDERILEPVTRLADEFEDFRKAATAAGMVVPTTPPPVCRGSISHFENDVSLARTDGRPNEEFYRWQLISGLKRVPLGNG
jgi:hypothetical protein